MASQMHGLLALCPHPPQVLIQEISDLLETPGDLKTLPLSEQRFVVTNLIFGLENVLRGVSKALPKGSWTFNSSAGMGKSVPESDHTFLLCFFPASLLFQSH